MRTRRPTGMRRIRTMMTRERMSCQFLRSRKADGVAERGFVTTVSKTGAKRRRTR
jgi:hypothetical protein